MEFTSLSTKPAISRSRWLIHLILIAGYLPATCILGSVFRKTSHAALSQTVGGLLSVGALGLLFFGIIFWLACVASRATRDDLLLRWKGTIQPVLWGAGYFVAFRIVLALLVIGIAIGLVATRIMTLDSLKHFCSANRADVGAVVDVAAMRNNPVYFWLTMTVVSFVLGGLREELWRSGVLAGMKALWPQHFGTRSGQVLAVIICAIIFGLGHLYLGWLAVCGAGFLGVGLGLIMIFHGSIWPAVIAHGLFDATSFAMFSWVVSHSTKIVS